MCESTWRTEEQQAEVDVEHEVERCAEEAGRVRAPAAQKVQRERRLPRAALALYEHQTRRPRRRHARLRARVYGASCAPQHQQDSNQSTVLAMLYPVSVNSECVSVWILRVHCEL